MAEKKEDVVEKKESKTKQAKGKVTKNEPIKEEPANEQKNSSEAPQEQKKGTWRFLHNNNIRIKILSQIVLFFLL